MAVTARRAARRTFEVGQVVRSVENLLATTPGMWVRGEVVGLRRGRDGRVLFFQLVDPRPGVEARLQVMSFASEMARGFDPADGMLVEGFGRLELSRRDGGLRLRLTHLEPAGEGELLRIIAERAERLAREGLFDPGRKRPLPFLPARVGLITAAGGAALDDVRRRMEARCPVPLTVVRAAMQGPACVGEVTAALRTLDADPRVDVIVIARGGGSLQDLMPFSDEGLVRAVAACATPVVSAVGHMRDTTLVCRASDRDAATPTAAADLVVPDLALLRVEVGAAGRRLGAAARRRVDLAARDLGALTGRPCLARPASLAEAPARATADLGRRLRAGLGTRAAGADAGLRGRGRALRVALRARGAAEGRDVAALGARAGRAAAACTRDAGARLAVLAARLAGADPTRPLASGFALVRDPAGRAVTGAAAAHAAGEVRLTFADGTVPATVTGGPA